MALGIWWGKVLCYRQYNKISKDFYFFYNIARVSVLEDLVEDAMGLLLEMMEEGKFYRADHGSVPKHKGVFRSRSHSQRAPGGGSTQCLEGALGRESRFQTAACGRMPVISGYWGRESCGD